MRGSEQRHGLLAVPGCGSAAAPPEPPASPPRPRAEPLPASAPAGALTARAASLPTEPRVQRALLDGGLASTPGSWSAARSAASSSRPHPAGCGRRRCAPPARRACR
jgi:hypothetical protein